MIKSKGHVVLCSLAVSLCLAFPAAAAELAGSEWRPTQIGELAPPDHAGLFVRFESDGKLAGHGGCNGFFGSYELQGGKIEIGPLGATQMACEQAIMDREARFLTALAAVATFERDGTSLTLRDESGTSLVVFVQTDWD